MSLLSKAALFALKEVAKPTLEEFGRKVGEATGKRLGRQIDPAPATPTEKKDAPSSDCACITEDERTP